MGDDFIVDGLEEDDLLAGLAPGELPARASDARGSEAFGSEALGSEALWSAALASADFASEDLASAGLAFDAIGFFVALELLVLLGRSDLFVPTSYLFFSSTV